MIDQILKEMSDKVESGQSIPQKEWIDYAFRLNTLILTQAETLGILGQEVAVKKLEVLKGQEKRNVSEADLVIETTNEYRYLKLEEAKMDQIKEFIRIAKLNASNL